MGRADATVALVVATALALLGAPVGLLWWAVAPPLHWIVIPGGAQLANSETEAIFAADAVFGFLTVGVGVLCGLAAWWWGRERGPGVPVGLAVGGAAASVVAAYVGRRVDDASFSHAIHTAAVGTPVQAFVTIAPDDPIGALPVLVGWALAAVVAFGVATWISSARRRRG